MVGAQAKGTRNPLTTTVTRLAGGGTVTFIGALRGQGYGTTVNNRQASGSQQGKEASIKHAIESHFTFMDYLRITVYLRKSNFMSQY